VANFGHYFRGAQGCAASGWPLRLAFVLEHIDEPIKTCEDAAFTQVSPA
jgi:hypothetical protein